MSSILVSWFGANELSAFIGAGIGLLFLIAMIFSFYKDIIIDARREANQKKQ